MSLCRHDNMSVRKKEWLPMCASKRSKKDADAGNKMQSAEKDCLSGGIVSGLTLDKGVDGIRRNTFVIAGS